MSSAIAELTPYLNARPAAVAHTRGLTKKYGDVTALHNVSMELRAGELLALLGPNGAGKTTLVRMLLGLASPDAGRVSVFGADPRQSNVSGTLRRHAAGRPRARDLEGARAHRSVLVVLPEPTAVG